MNIVEARKTCLESAYGHRARNTVRTYGQSLDRFFEYLEELGVGPKDDVSVLSTDQFVRFPAWLSNHFAKRTCGVYIFGVKYFMEWLITEEILKPDYAQSIRIKHATETVMRHRSDPLPHIPAKGHLDKMLEAVQQMNEPSPRKERDIALLLFLASSGCRNGETAVLTVGDLDLVERQVIVTGKNEKQRFAFFSHEAAAAIRDYWTERGFSGKKDPAFARHDLGAGKRHSAVTTSTIRNIVSDVCALAGIDKGKFTPHYFRHAFAIEVMQKTGNLALVQDLLGHASPATTRIYATIYPDDLKSAHSEVFRK
jgi:site-specific recombinase XerD